MLRVVAVLLLVFTITFGRNIDVETNEIDVTESNAAVRFSDEEIRAALKFMVLAPRNNNQMELQAMIRGMCEVMNNNPMSQDEMGLLATSPNDPRLEDVKTQMSLLIVPESLTNANIISMKRMCVDIAKVLTETAL